MVWVEKGGGPGEHRHIVLYQRLSLSAKQTSLKFQKSQLEIV